MSFKTTLNGQWVFHTTVGITGTANLRLGDVELRGVSAWSGFSTHGASGCPLFANE